MGILVMGTSLEVRIKAQDDAPTSTLDQAQAFNSAEDGSFGTHQIDKMMSATRLMAMHLCPIEKNC